MQWLFLNHNVAVFVLCVEAQYGLFNAGENKQGLFLGTSFISYSGIANQYIPSSLTGGGMEVTSPPKGGEGIEEAKTSEVSRRESKTEEQSSELRFTDDTHERPEAGETATNT